MDFIVKNISTQGFYNYCILGLILFLTLIRVLFPVQFIDFINVIKNKSYEVIYNKKHKKNLIFNSLFFLFFTSNLGLIIARLTHNSINNQSTEIQHFILCLILIIVLSLSRLLVEKITFETLSLINLFKRINFQRSTLFNYISLFLFGLNVFTLYIYPGKNLEFHSSFSWILLFVLYVITFLFITFKNLKIFLNHWFYFILYLCAFEISPILIGVFLITK